MTALSLSIVVAVTDVDDDASVSLPMEWLTAILREAQSTDAEVLIAGVHGAARARLTSQTAGAARVRMLDAAPNMLTPELWGLGLVSATGDVVAFTINQCVVPVGWARTIVTEMAKGDAGVGGPLHLAPGASGTGRAIYCLRYSAFLSSGTERRQVRDIAGDNAAYRRDVLMRYGTYSHGFWEIEAHHWLRADGGTLALVPSMGVAFGGAPHLQSFMRQRFAHGRHFGEWRVRIGKQAPWRVLLASPLVPFVLGVRTARRLAAHRNMLGVLLGCLPQFLALAGSWSAGEASGALTARATSVDGKVV